MQHARCGGAAPDGLFRLFWLEVLRAWPINALRPRSTEKVLPGEYPMAQVYTNMVENTHLINSNGIDFAQPWFGG